MEFRWIAALTLWTMFVGPMLNAPLTSVNSRPADNRQVAFGKLTQQ